MQVSQDLMDLASELRTILSSVTGVKGLSENVSLQYVVVVENEDSKINVAKIGDVLVQKAENYGIDLLITPATQEEIDEARQKLADHMSNKA